MAILILIILLLLVLSLYPAVWDLYLSIEFVVLHVLCSRHV